MNRRDEEGCTGLHLAADVVYECLPSNWEEYVELGAEGVRVCLAAGAEVDAVDDHGRTPLYLAARAGQSASVRRLLEAKASPDVEVTVGEGQISSPRQAAEAVVSGVQEAAWCMHCERCEAIVSAMSE